jgi:hypothetical protein
MKRQSDDQALATLMQAAQGGDTQAYVLLLKEITPRLRQIVRGQRRLRAGQVSARLKFPFTVQWLPFARR